MSQIDELRQIIVGDNSEQLSELKDRIESLDQRTRDVAEVLPPAIDAGLRSGDGLVDALRAPVSEGLKRAIREEPKAYAEILYPVMAPSIRRAISQAISSLLVTINRTMESATTVSGLRTRIQSMRTGIPYAELALRRSLVYRVEHVYLIDRDSGLLIDEVASQEAQSLDSDAVSAMFSAIQSFVQDSFSGGDDARLTDLKVGEHNVWVAHGARAMLACVIYGDAPESLKSQLYDTLDVVRTKYAIALADFESDSSAFAGVDKEIRPLLQLQLKEEGATQEQQASRQAMWPWLIVLALVAYFSVQWVDRAAKLDTLEHFFRQTPGVAITDVYWRDKKIVVEGLKDPDARIPYTILAGYGIAESDIDMATIPFRSLERAMELQRFREELSLPEGVYFGDRNGKIYLYGDAPIAWLDENGGRLRQLAADRRLDITRLSPSFESVSEILRGNFSRSELANLKMGSVSRDEHTRLQIGGEFSAPTLAMLNVLFARSYWVEIVASLSATQVTPK